jgi:hypothetical protein
MRYAKDSSALFNPRQFYWQDLYNTQRRYITRPFSIATIQKSALIGMISKNVVAYFYHWNRLLESVNLYLPKNKRILFSPHWMVFSAGFIIGCTLHFIDTRLWKERKWDAEPGVMLPVRRPFLHRIYMQYIKMKWSMFLYYHGLFLDKKDLDMALNIEHIAQGRMYRRTLAMEYAYKEKRMKMRDDRYDFLDFSAQHGQTIS